DLTISNTNTAGATIRFINDAHNDAVLNCVVQGVNNTSTSGVILFSTTSGTTGNDNNLIDNNDIRDGSTTPTIGIFALGTGTAATQNSGVTVSNNNIFN